MSIPLDKNGQPVSLDYNRNRRINRALNELSGFLRGIVIDGVVSDAETESLAKWLVANREIEEAWQVKRLADRIAEIYRDGIADEQERIDLKELIEQIVGGFDDEEFLCTPTTLPLTKPLPDVIFDSNEFVFTGRFLYGSRRRCHQEVLVRGGSVSDTVRLRTSYSVIGSLVSRDWKFTSFGNKIIKAVEYTQHCPISIISEEHWQSFILDAESKAHAAGMR